MSKTIVPGFLGVICWLMLCIPPAVLADDSPQSKPEAGKQQVAASDGAKPLGCNSPELSNRVISTAGGSSIVQETGYGLQRKSWSPLGDTIRFTIKSFSAIPEDASVLVCFRWESGSASKGGFLETHPSQLDLSSDRKQLNVTVKVPDDLGAQPANVNHVALLPLVPLAEVQILALDHANHLVADVPAEIGITSPFAAVVLAIVATILGLAILSRVKRPQAVGIRKARWLLQLISTKDGFASLSQLQVLLWTFVVAVSAVYVMSLSGRLVEITSGTLILLGIAGAAGVGAAVHNGAQITNAQSAADDAAATHAKAQNAAAQAAVATQAATDAKEAARLAQEKQDDAGKKAGEAEKLKKIAERLKNPPEDQIPKWSDLLINQTITDTGVVAQEVDVTRVQMLLFTLVTAVFVLITVATTYVIPEIPSGFVTLMGISNGVYLGSKITS
jgi:hypothetical protein